jgi:hypothetical protein
VSFDLGNVPSLAEQCATSSSGLMARAAFGCLCVNQITRLRLADARPVLRVLFRARDPRMAEVARRRLERHGYPGRGDEYRLYSALWMLVIDREHPGRFRDMTYSAARYLLAPAEPAFEGPKVRLVAAFRHAQSHVQHSVADALVDAAVHADDERVREALTAVMIATDQPDLLDALHRAWWKECERWSELLDAGVDPGGPLPLDAGLARITEVLRSNPELSRRWPRTAGMLAVLEDRADLSAGISPSEYRVGLAHLLRRSTSTVLRQRCRAVLRRPWMAEALCLAVMRGDDGESLKAWLEIGHLAVKQSCQAAFLFWTREWDAYDRLDPNGKRLRRFLLDQKRSPGRRRLRKIAEEAGRPDPCPPDWIEQQRRQVTEERRGPLGSWPTSPMSPGSHGFGTTF